MHGSEHQGLTEGATPPQARRRAGPITASAPPADAGPWEAPRQARTVLLVDDEELMPTGLRAELAAKGFEVVGEAGDLDTAVALAQELTPDIVLVDAQLNDGSGVETTRRILQTLQATRVLILDGTDDSELVTEALFAGACGFLVKGAERGTISRAVQDAADGGSPVSPGAARVILEVLRRQRGVVSSSHPKPDLTARERQILALLTEGMENAEIDAELFLSVDTVKSHVSQILEKFRVDNRLQAAVYAVRNHLA